MTAEHQEHDPIRLGLLGTGAIAQVVHLPTLAQMRGADVVAVGDIERSKANAIATRFGIPRVFGSDEEVLRSDVEGVIICTPSHLHEAQAIAALESGKHVLVEKPLALTPEGAQRVIDAAERADRALMVALNNRYRADSRALKPFAVNGELGDVFFVKGGWFNRKVRVARPTWRHSRATAGGGALMDLGVQVVDLCLWFLDYPRVKRVVAHTHPGEGMEVEDSASILMEAENGRVISVEVTWSFLGTRDRHYVQLLGTHGTATLSPFSVHKEVEQGLLDVTPKLPATRPDTYTGTYRDQIAHFLGVIQGRIERQLPREQVRLMELIQRAYESAETRREVVLEG